MRAERDSERFSGGAAGRSHGLREACLLDAQGAVNPLEALLLESDGVEFRVEQAVLVLPLATRGHGAVEQCVRLRQLRLEASLLDEELLVEATHLFDLVGERIASRRQRDQGSLLGLDQLRLVRVFRLELTQTGLTAARPRLTEGANQTRKKQVSTVSPTMVVCWSMILDSVELT